MSKVHTLRCAAYNVGLLMRKAWGLGKPRSATGFCAFLWLLAVATVVIGRAIDSPISSCQGEYGWLLIMTIMAISIRFSLGFPKKHHFLTGC